MMEISDAGMEAYIQLDERANQAILDHQFEELTKPVYKGKKLADPIPSRTVWPIFRTFMCAD
jgi:hypothetical protein